MAHPTHLNLHRISKLFNISLALLFLIHLIMGIAFSPFFHLGTLLLGLLNLLNIYYLFIQRRHTILRNFGLMGKLRYLLESVGPELRQYLISNDTEERPFNRDQRSEVYRKAKNIDSTASFGSLLEFDNSEIKIRHSMFPVSLEGTNPFRVTFGDTRDLEHPYTIEKPLMISAMSYGSLGSHAIRALSRGAYLSGIPINTGEGGYPKHHLLEKADLIFQIGTAKFGVRHKDGSLDELKLKELSQHPQVKMIELKFSQGAKPGKGGLLPKEKITPEIAEIRGVPLGYDIVSPPYHAECSDLPSTVAFLKHIQSLVSIPVGIKLCLGQTIEFQSLVREFKHQNTFPDWIALDGAEGGTGASPHAFLDQVGVPLFPSLHAVNTILREEGVRHKTKLIASGKLITPNKQLVAFALGADAVYSARGFMLALGCIQALQCGQNTCPIGITTHNPALQRGLDPEIKAQRIKHYVDNSVYDLKELLTASGKTTLEDLTIENLYIPEDASLAPFIKSPVSFSHQ